MSIVLPSTNYGPSWYTLPASAAVAPWGWAHLDDVFDVAIVVDTSARPLDNGAPLFARLTYRGALDVAAREHAALIFPSQVRELQQRASRAIAPITLPDDEIRSAARGILAHRPGESPEAWNQRLRNAGMTTEAWARHHDARFWAQLGTWEPGELVAGAGKHWVSGAPAGRAYLAGWWNGRSFIQPIPNPTDRGFHDDAHHDYATTTILVRRRDGAAIVAPGAGTTRPTLPGGSSPGGSSPGTAPSSTIGAALALGGVLASGAVLAWYLATHWSEIERRLALGQRPSSRRG